MAPRVKKSPVITTIDKNFALFLKDPDYKKGIKKLNRRRLHNKFEYLKKEYSKFIKFYVYRRRMKYMKVVQGSLSARSEKYLVNRGYAALDSYRKILIKLKEIEEMWKSTGVIKAINRHAPKVCRYMQYSKKHKPITDEIKRLGVPRDAINWLDYEFRAINYNVLRYDGGNGTFSGLVKRASNLLPIMEKDIRNTEKYGLATITGAGDDKDEYAAAGAAIVTAIIVGLIFGFCMKWD